MELTAEQVDTVEATRQLVKDLIEYAEEYEDSPFAVQNLEILEAQLDNLHQALSLIVAQEKAIEEKYGGDDG